MSTATPVYVGSVFIRRRSFFRQDIDADKDFMLHQNNYNGRLDSEKYMNNKEATETETETSKFPATHLRILLPREIQVKSARVLFLYYLQAPF